MLEKISKFCLLISSFIAILLLIVVTDRTFFFLHAGMFNSYEKALLEPIFVWLIATFISTLSLFFVQAKVFSLWKKYIFSWYLPLGLVLTFLTSPNLSYAFPDRLGVATILSWGLVVLTIVFIAGNLLYSSKKK